MGEAQKDVIEEITSENSLEGEFFQSHVPFDKMSSLEVQSFSDLHGPSSHAFIQIRNKILEMWFENPKKRLIENAVLNLEAPYSDDPSLVLRTHAFLERHGFINYEINAHVTPLPDPSSADSDTLKIMQDPEDTQPYDGELPSSLYEDHQIKEEIVISSTVLKKPTSSYSSSAMMKKNKLYNEEETEVKKTSTAENIYEVGQHNTPNIPKKPLSASELPDGSHARRSPEDYGGLREVVRTSLRRRGIMQCRISLIEAAISDDTVKEYDTYLKKWFAYCQENNIDAYMASKADALGFLTHFFKEEKRYGKLYRCQSALSLLLGQDIKDRRHTNRYVKEAFRSQPPSPNNVDNSLFWDVQQVLNYLATLYPNEDLNLETISKKLITLLFIVSFHRIKTLSKIKIINISLSFSGALINIQPVLSLPYFSDRPQICPAYTLNAYVEKTKTIRRRINLLFISPRMSHRGVTSTTLYQWVRSLLESCGVNFAYRIPEDVIRKNACWSATDPVFAKYCKRAVSSDSSNG